MRLINPNSAIGQASRTDWIIYGATVVVLIALELVSTFEKAFAVSLTFLVFAIVIQTKWTSRGDPRVWALLGAVAAGQLSAIFLVHVPRIPISLSVLPIVLIEGFALLGLLNWMERRFPRA